MLYRYSLGPAWVWTEILTFFWAGPRSGLVFSYYIEPGWTAKFFPRVGPGSGRIFYFNNGPIFFSFGPGRISFFYGSGWAWAWKFQLVRPLMNTSPLILLNNEVPCLKHDFSFQSLIKLLFDAVY